MENYKIHSVLLKNDSLVNFKSSRKDYVKLFKEENLIRGVLETNEPVEINLDSVKSFETKVKLLQESSTSTKIIGYVLLIGLSFIGLGYYFAHCEEC